MVSGTDRRGTNVPRRRAEPPLLRPSPGCDGEGGPLCWSGNGSTTGGEGEGAALVAGAGGSEASLVAVDWAVAQAVRHGLPPRLMYACLWDCGP